MNSQLIYFLSVLGILILVGLIALYAWMRRNNKRWAFNGFASLRNVSLKFALGILSQVCAVLVAVMGLIVLFGWLLGSPYLSSLGAGNIPMAPSTAVLFVLYATLIFLRARFPSSRTAYTAGLLTSLTGGLAALALFFLSYRGIYLEIEHIGISIMHAAGQTTIGHMSPVSAICFVIASLSYLTLLYSTQRSKRADFSLWLACILAVVGFSLLLMYLFGVPILYGGSFIPPAALTSIAFIALGIALMGLAAPHFSLLRDDDNSNSSIRAGFVYVLIFILLAVGIFSSSYISYRNFEKQYRIHAESQLSAIAELKEKNLVNWRTERLADADMLQQNPAFAALAQAYLKDPQDGAAQSQIQAWLAIYKLYYEYERVNLLDTQGRTLLSSPPEAQPLSLDVVKRIPEVLQSKQSIMVDFLRRESDQQIRMYLLIPILDSQPGSRVIGLVSIGIDPQKYLYPFINEWPVNSSTAETLLVRRDGNEVWYLNEIRFDPNAPLVLHFPLTDTKLEAVKAVLGKSGIVQGQDYRGKEVLADVRPVPDSPWFMVSKMDLAEIDIPLKERLWQTFLLAGMAILVAGAGLMIVWRQQRIQFYRTQAEAAEALRESEARFRAFVMTSSNVVYRMSPDWGVMRQLDGRGFIVDTIEPNDNWLQEYIHPDDQPLVTTVINEAIRTKSIFELEHQVWRVDGTLGWTFSRGIPLLDEQGQITEWFGAASDITARKRAEDEIRKLNEELEERVIQRTAQLEATNKELEAFTYSVSHDLRAPLRAISGYTNILIEDYEPLLDAEGKRISTVISSEAQRMGRLIDDLLAFSRLSRKEMRTSMLDMKAMAQTVFNELTQPDEQGRIDFQIQNLPPAAGDAALIHQVWVNLLSNALKFTSKKERANIEVGSKQSKNETIYYVRDNGAGFDMQYAGKLFGVFQRLHNENEFEGTGVGLAIVQRVILRHGGRVWGEGLTDQGAVFYFALPGKEATND